MHAIVIRPLTSHPYKTRMEHAGFSPDQARGGGEGRRGDGENRSIHRLPHITC
ncbi:unnamed protein product [Sphacelaria rigidula]